MTDPSLQDQLANFEAVVLRRDVELAESVLHADYALVRVQPELGVMHRARWLEVLPEYHVHEYEVETEQLDVAASCASLLQRVRMRATVLGEDRSGIFVISDVWLSEADGWRVWRRHSTPMTAGAMPGTS